MNQYIWQARYGRAQYKKGFASIILIGIILLILVAGYFVLVKKSEPTASQSPVSQTPTPTSTQAGVATETQYLLFQMFTGLNDGTGVFHQPFSDPGQLKAVMGEYVSKIQDKLQPSSITIAKNRKYGFAIGPLSLDQPDQELKDTIKTAFDVALEKNVAVGLHFDITHFWKKAKNTDGTLLSAGTGDNDIREWKDFNGTIADKDPWDGEQGILPSMCFECPQVKSLVDHVASEVIAPAVNAGLARLKSANKQELFAGVIVGWEAGSLNYVGYHSLKLKGFTSANTLPQLKKGQQQILHDYLERWAKDLFDKGIPRTNIYTHTSSFTQWDEDYFGSSNGDSANVPDSFWNSFNDYSNAGFSIYINSSQEGIFEAIWAEAAKHSGSWAEAEGTNARMVAVSDAAPSDISWETYLGKIFNHGGTMANIFAGFIGGPGAGGYTIATESDEAVAAYKKFLQGEQLIEIEPAPGASTTPASIKDFPNKMQKIQKELPLWMQQNPSRQKEVGALMQKLDGYIKANNPQEAEKIADEILGFIGK